jgi:hypothetical protein
MNTKKNDQNQGHGRGLVPLGDALALAVVETDNVKAAEFVGAALGVELGAEQVAQGMEARSIGGAALASCERPAGPLLLEAQGQFDLALADRCARKLAGRMVADGATFFTTRATFATLLRSFRCPSSFFMSENISSDLSLFSGRTSFTL